MIYLVPNAKLAREGGLIKVKGRKGAQEAEGRTVDLRPLWARPDIGLLMTPASGIASVALDHVAIWAADTGCFRQGARFSWDAYLDWLRRVGRTADCLFALAPDVVGDAARTLALARNTLPRLRELGYPAGLVAQDGLEALDVPWDTFDVLFVGGTTAWKLSEPAFALAREAARRGKHTHLGRVNSWIRLSAAHGGGYRSADGTCLVRDPPLYAEAIPRWLDRLQERPQLRLWD